jgi:hypothetical protein
VPFLSDGWIAIVDVAMRNPFMAPQNSFLFSKTCTRGRKRIEARNNKYEVFSSISSEEDEFLTNMAGHSDSTFFATAPQKKEMLSTHSREVEKEKRKQKTSISKTIK